MKREITIDEYEYRKLVNLAKLNEAKINKKAYKIAEKINEIKVYVDVEASNYQKEFHVTVRGEIDNYCLLGSHKNSYSNPNYRETPEPLRKAIRSVDKLLQRRVNAMVALQYGRMADILRGRQIAHNYAFWMSLISVGLLVLLLLN